MVCSTSCMVTDFPQILHVIALIWCISHIRDLLLTCVHSYLNEALKSLIDKMCNIQSMLAGGLLCSMSGGQDVLFCQKSPKCQYLQVLLLRQYFLQKAIFYDIRMFSSTLEAKHRGSFCLTAVRSDYKLILSQRNFYSVFLTQVKYH